MFRNLNRLFLPDREHLHHQLLDLGYGHRSAVLILYGAVVALAVAALTLVIVKSRLVAVIIVTILAVGLICFVLINSATRSRERKTRINGENPDTERIT
jgi:UDP-GlcNAc:undecaprenyl-phosphate GlcNAc-1-phosphate transferase